MFSHVFVGVTDFQRALDFYRPVMQVLELEERFCDLVRPWAGWHRRGEARPLFVISPPYDGAAHAAGNGQMIAFAATDRATVRRVHETALEHHGRDEGAPGLRPEYHDDYYAAYFRDPDGNKLCVVCHAAEPG